jgi:hypothetical protein
MLLRNKTRMTAGALLLVGGLGLVGCGGGGSTSASSAPTATPMQVSLGDAPADWIMAFGMTVTSISLMNSSGTSVNVVPTATPMEMMQLMATVQPVSALNVPQGTYTQATVTVASVSMGYLDPVSHTYKQKTMAGPFTATVPFSPSLTVGTSPMALNFDMNMASSVAIDGAGNVTFAPVMTAAMGAVSSSAPDPFQGGMQHMVGGVTSQSGSKFTMSSLMGMQTTTFTTNSNTQFPASGMNGMGMMGNGMMVAVDAMMQADGSYLAQRVEYMGAAAAGMLGGGLVSSVTGTPPTQLTLIANGGMGNGMMASSIAGTITVALPASVPYSFDANGVDLTGLPFTPAFGASSLMTGQKVEVVSGGGMMAGGMMGGLGTVTASQVRLEQQGLHGSVSAYTASGSQASFTLMLPTDSAFTTLTGAASIQVYKQTGTQLRGLTTVGNGANVQTRGLLFYDAGTYKLVATCIESGAAVTVAPPAAGTTAMQVGFGDAPADWILAFGNTVNSILLTKADGSTVNVVPAAAPVEMMQTMGSMQPISTMNVPQGSYTQAAITLSAVSMGYMDPTSHTYLQKTMAGPFTATVPFSPMLTVGTNPMALNFDMNMAASVSIDGSGNVIFTPTLTAMNASVASNGANPWQGGMQHQVGRVSSLSGSQFTMGSMMGVQTMTLATNSATQFPSSGLTGMGMMSTGMMVAVDATLQADGSYLAQRVEYMGAGVTGMMGGGLVTAITGNPPTQLTLVANGGMGGGMMASSIGGTITATLPASVPYSFDADAVDLTNLPFTPAFGPTSLAKGQKLELVSATSMMGGGMMGGGSTGSLGALTASRVRLEQQGLHGVVSAYTASGSQATFTLTLPSDSAFSTIAGTTAITVYQQAGTQLQGLPSVANGNDVQARGLLFYDAGTYKLISSWLTAH